MKTKTKIGSREGAKGPSGRALDQRPWPDRKADLIARVALARMGIRGSAGVPTARHAECFKLVDSIRNEVDRLPPSVDREAWLEESAREARHDPVNHPKHYTGHPSKVECIQITEHMSFCLGNAMKYIWRADLKQDALEDLKKARWYLDREIARRESFRTGTVRTPE